MSKLSLPGRYSLRRLASIAALAAVAVLAPRFAAPALAAADWRTAVPVVKTTSGAVSGIYLPGPTHDRDMQAYLGIPYAAAPGGANRWTPPRPPVPWSGVRAATAFGHHCPQAPGAFGVASLTEDCLNINVFAPPGTKAGARLPVMVWIHGGAYVSGESDDYNPDRLVARNVIVVTLNYRLGYLGIFATTGLDKEAHAHADYGTMDQQFALRWVRANIAGFGGDTTRTTVFGESAGGSSTFMQVLSPGSKGLFSAAIVESGAYDVLSLPSLATVEAQGNAVAAAAKCAPSNTACLRALPVADLIALEAKYGGAFGLNPAVDGTVIPEPGGVALATGAFNHVPIFQGTNHDEFRLFTAGLFDLAGGPLTAPEYPTAVAEILASGGLGAATQAVLAQYPLSNYASPDLAYSALVTDAVFSANAYITDSLLAKQTWTYAYEFADEHAPQIFLPPVSFPYGAAHASELQYIFDVRSGGTPPTYTQAQTRLATSMVKYWTRFATYHVPQSDEGPTVPLFNAAQSDMVALVPPVPQLYYGFAADHKVPFWVGVLTAAAQHAPAAKVPGITIDEVERAAHALRPGAPF